MLKNKPPFDKNTFLMLLNEAHSESGRSLREVGDFCGLSPSYIHRILIGNRHPRREKLLALCLFGWGLDPYDTDEILRSGGYKTIMDWSKLGWE